MTVKLQRFFKAQSGKSLHNFDTLKIFYKLVTVLKIVVDKPSMPDHIAATIDNGLVRKIYLLIFGWVFLDSFSMWKFSTVKKLVEWWKLLKNVFNVAVFRFLPSAIKGRGNTLPHSPTVNKIKQIKMCDIFQTIQKKGKCKFFWVNFLKLWDKVLLFFLFLVSPAGRSFVKALIPISYTVIWIKEENLFQVTFPPL